MKMKDLECNGCVIVEHKVYIVVKNKILLHFYKPRVFYHVNYLFINTGESNYFFRGPVFLINHSARIFRGLFLVW